MLNTCEHTPRVRTRKGQTGFATEGSPPSRIGVIAASGVCVRRASISRFVRGERSLRLDAADKLAAYFGLVLVPDPIQKG